MVPTNPGQEGMPQPRAPGGSEGIPMGNNDQETDLGTAVGVPVVLLLSCCILAIMFYCRCYRPLQRKKTLERAHVTYIADPTSRPGNNFI